MCLLSFARAALLEMDLEIHHFKVQAYYNSDMILANSELQA